MSISIKPGAIDNLFFVNGKGIRKDMDGSWIAWPELTENEKKHFYEYLKTVEEEGIPAPEVTYEI